MSKTYAASLQSSVQTSYSNNGKTTILGRASQKTINSQQVIGPTLTGFVDVFTTTGVTPSMSQYNSTTGQLFILSSASATPNVLLYNFNQTTGAASYVGKITMNLANAAATTHTFRGFKVYVNGSTIVCAVATTGSVLINGGTFIANNLTAADFTVGGTTIYPASGSGQKAVYFLQDPSLTGYTNNLTTLGGVLTPSSSSNSAINTKLFAQNGAAASLEIISWDLASTPTVNNITTVNGQSTSFAGTSPAAYFSLGASNLGFSTTNPTAAAFDAVVLQGSVPTGFTAWASGTAQVAASNVYFIRDLQLVSGTWYFNLASTAAGAAIAPTSTVSGITLMRAFGISNNTFNFKTGTLPALAGTLLQSNSFDYVVPASTPANTALQSQDCIAMATSTTVYLGKISDLSSLGTTWSSLTPVTVAGGTTVVAPVLTAAAYNNRGNSNDIDKWIVLSNTSSFLAFPHQASMITAAFGGLVTSWLEGQNPPTVQFGAAAISDIGTSAGMAFATSTTAGQRGILYMDMGSDANFGIAAVISPVISIQAGATFKYINTLEQLFDYTDSMYFWIRNGTTSTASAFSTASIPTPSNNNGWTLIHTAQDLSAVNIGPYFQLCATYQIMTLDANTPAQLNDFEYTVQLPGESATDWVIDVDSTTVGTNTPSYVAFQCVSIPTSLPTTLYIKGYDSSGNIISGVTDNTAANLSKFSYSTDGGTTWNAVTTVSSLFTVGYKVRYNVTSPPGITAFMSLRYSA